MTPHWPWVLALTLAQTAAGSDLRTQCAGVPRSQVQVLDTASASYTVRMGGKIDGAMTRDPVGYWAYDQYWEPNVSVGLENIGDTPVINPWIRRVGQPDTRNLQTIVASIVQPGMSDKEKARRLWEYEIQGRFHATTQDEEVGDEVKRVNIYGYSLCYDTSKGLSDLWRAAGLKVRQGFPNGHSLAEVYYEGSWHLLDSDESIVSLLRDNESIASEAQVVADHDLMKRTHTYGPLQNDDRMTDESSAALLYWEGERSGEQPSLTHHDMGFTLRPGEAIHWAWNPANRYHAEPFSFADGDAENWNKRWRVIAHIMDGEMTYSPDLTKASTLQYLKTEGIVRKSGGLFGAGLYLNGGQGSVLLPVKAAYPIVGGRLEVDFARLQMNTESADVSLSFDEGKSWKEVWLSASSDYNRMYLDLDPFFSKTDPARYGYLLRFTLSSQAKVPAVALKGIYLRSTLEMAPLAMPGVALGTNQFLFSDDNPGESKVRITHVWNECDAQIAVPDAPESISPGQLASGTQVRFEWKPGAGAAPADYEFQLSEFSDMRWVLSPNFHKLISRTENRGTPHYVLPYLGLLNPNQTYYWRVRGRSEDGVWGPWSKTFSFSAMAPGVPLYAAAMFDHERRVVRLAWKAGTAGSVPARYQVYGSAERGFTANDHPYDYFAGLDGVRKSPANLLLETERTTQSIELPPELWRPYYRLVAIDDLGRVSGASAIAELPHPLIATSKLPEAHRAHHYEAKMTTSASIGHLVSADENGKQYQMRYRAGDELVYSVMGGPPGLSIDNSGLISGFIDSASQDHYEVVVTVKNKVTGNGDSATFSLAVAADTL